MSDKNLRFQNIGYQKSSFDRSDSEDDSDQEAVSEGGDLGPRVGHAQRFTRSYSNPACPPMPISSCLSQLSLKNGTEEEGVPIPKAPVPPMHRNPGGLERRSSLSQRQHARQGTLDAIKAKLGVNQMSGFTGMPSPSTSGSNEAAGAFQPSAMVPYQQLLQQWETISAIDERNYHSRWNQDTELIRLVRQGDIHGLKVYRERLGQSHRWQIEINTLNASCLTPLAIALYQHNQRAIEVLLEMGARPDIKHSFGNNCFHLVAENDSQGLSMSTLLDMSNNRFGQQELYGMLNTPNMFNATPLDILSCRLGKHRDCRDHQLQTMIELMKKYGAEYRSSR